MTEQQLKKQNRSELLKILLNVTRESEQLHSELEQMQQKLDDRRIETDKAGSIAEASLQLNGVFQAAEEVCKRILSS